MEVKVNINLAGTIVDEEAHKLSAIIDADSDRQRIADNPGTKGYRRPASELERVACGLGDSPTCLLYTSPSPRDKRQSRMPSSA